MRRPGAAHVARLRIGHESIRRRAHLLAPRQLLPLLGELLPRTLEQAVELVFGHLLQRAEVGPRQRGPLEVTQQADTIAAAERAIGASHPGATVVATEPVAHYLLVNSGIVDKTPEGFTKSIEEDTDPSPADLAAVLDLLKNRQVSALVYNTQTQTDVTKQIQDAANQASVPIITVTETLPAGTDYLTWQRQTVDQLASQLDKAPQTNR